MNRRSEANSFPLLCEGNKSRVEEILRVWEKRDMAEIKYAVCVGMGVQRQGEEALARQVTRPFAASKAEAAVVLLALV